MNGCRITISIVTYNTPESVFSKCLESICRITVPFTCFIVDNAANRQIENQIRHFRQFLHAAGELQYIPNENTGYGRAHNIAVRRALQEANGRFHLVMNPDICFEPGTVETLLRYMDENPQAGLVMPKILYPDGSLQKLCKLLPTPWHLFARRFWPRLVKKQDAHFQMEFADYNHPFECPFLSGCFMFLRVDALKTAGLFDERFFMYFEDVDLVRRIGRHYKTLFCPFATVIHHYEKGSYSSIRLLLNHMVSGVKYFHKWGWFRDLERKRTNQRMLKQAGNACRINK